MKSILATLAWLITAAAISGTQVATAADVHVIDGDTLSIDETHYRLFGVDAPEAGQTCTDEKGGIWRCGREATRHLEQLVGAGVVSCDNRGVDDYDRIIAVCRARGQDLNRQMIVDGYAWAFRRFAEDYAREEDIAAAARIGIWRAATETPWDYRARRWEVAVQVAPEGCPIKGNISKSAKIYHTPWSPWYDRTKVSVEDGERWFCTERDALDAGWRAPAWGN